LIAGFFALPETTSFEQAVAYLDSDAMATSIGDVRISVYSATKILVTLLVLLWAAAFVSAFGQRRLRALKKLRTANREILAKGFMILVYVVAFLIGIEAVGLDLTAFAVLGGAVGIGIGFGLQKIASNFISGLILLMERSVRLGDLVEFSDGTAGFVRRLGARYTLIEGFDGRETLIPNEDFITSRVTSLTFSNRAARVEIPIGVHYKSDLKKVRGILLEAAAAHPACSKERPPVCYLRAFGPSSVDFVLFFWIDNVEEGRFAPQSEVMFAVWDAFKAAGVEIPYPQQDLYIKELPRSGNPK
ncbi:MAG TPA: mechanosensitive ion channel domain-containing protein, partial [Sphingomonadales bacterium]|nr:mechanosensitive ion channel domain-containing protein [Sphingomonadales bacterium]